MTDRQSMVAEDVLVDALGFQAAFALRQAAKDAPLVRPLQQLRALEAHHAAQGFGYGVELRRYAAQN